MDIVYQDNKHYLSKSMSFFLAQCGGLFRFGRKRERLDGMEGQERQNTR